MKTYITMYQNEQRAVELYIRDQAEAAYAPSTAYASVNDAEGNEVVGESAAMVSGSSIYYLVTPTVTQAPGEYDIIWRILKSGTDTYTFYHKTRVVVEEL
jgi:ABC-type phosphate/phosphonate transport system substrate-binding protein